MNTPALARIGRGAATRPWRVIGAWLLLAVLVSTASGLFGATLEDSMSAPGVDAQQATDLLTETGAGVGGLTAQVVVTPSDPGATFTGSEDARAALGALQRRAEALPHVLGSNDPAGAFAADGTAAEDRGIVSPDGRVALLRLQYPPVEELSADDLDRLKSLADAPEAGPLQVELGGDLFFAFESPPAGIGELIGLLVAAVILFLAFGSLVAAALPLVTAIAGLVVGIGAIALLGNAFTVPSFATVLGSMVGLGVGIDYALFIVTRHREALAGGLPVADATARSLATAGRPVVFAGGIVVLSILGLGVSGVPFLVAGGVAIALVVLVMVAASITLLPALLGLAGTRIDRLALPRRRDAARAPHAGWSRWIRHVTRHPAGYALAATGLLLALTAPVLALRVGIPDDGALPRERTERRAYDLVAEGFGPGSNGPLVVVAALNGDTAAAERLADAVRGDAGIASVEPTRVDPQGRVATIVALPVSGPQDQATYATIDRLRAEVFPAALAGSPAEAHVGGSTALLADVGGRVFERLPVFVAAVLAMSFLLLMLVFRSVLVPLKAVLLNLLSIGAAYGVLVAVFQWGWAGGLIGLQETVPVVSFIPVFMFAILFGLSMDYEVFLLSRVREEYVRTGDDRTAIVRGIAGSGRVITSAALIMVSVFMAFVLGPDAATKMMGLGLATAVLIDATLVRMVLVPATMTLLGRANWWLPAWLDRVLPHVDVEAAPDPAAEPGVASDAELDVRDGEVSPRYTPPPVESVPLP